MTGGSDVFCLFVFVWEFLKSRGMVGLLRYLIFVRSALCFIFGFLVSIVDQAKSFYTKAETHLESLQRLKEVGYDFEMQAIQLKAEARLKMGLREMGIPKPFPTPVNIQF